MFSLIALITSTILNIQAGCEHKTDEFTCNYFSPCVWKDDKCIFGKRHLNSDKDLYSLKANGTPKIGLNK